MHSGIVVITFAEDVEDARDRVEDVIDSLVSKNAFDYGDIIDKTVLADSEKGSKMISDAMKATKESFFENMKQVRKLLSAFSDEEIFEEKANRDVPEKKDDPFFDVGMARYYMYKAGQYAGNGIFLYDDDGQSIRTTEHLNQVLSKWDEISDIRDRYKGKNVYVTLCDCHF